MTFTRISVITALLTCLCLPAAAQIIDPDVTGHSAPTGAPGTLGLTGTTPQYFGTVGAGFSQYSDPKFTASFSFGYRLGNGTYLVTSLDEGTKRVTDPLLIDPKTGKPAIVRKPISTLRTGFQRILTQQGPLTLTAAIDAGLEAGAGNVVGAFSGGGAVAFDPKPLRDRHLFVFGAARILKSPSPVANVDPAVVQTAFTFGIGWHN